MVRAKYARRRREKRKNSCSRSGADAGAKLLSASANLLTANLLLEVDGVE